MRSRASRIVIDSPERPSSAAAASPAAPAPTTMTSAPRSINFLTSLANSHLTRCILGAASHRKIFRVRQLSNAVTPMRLPIDKRYRPMEAQPASALPEGPEWQYEPKWDGFRCLAFRDHKRI